MAGAGELADLIEKIPSRDFVWRGGDHNFNIQQIRLKQSPKLKTDQPRIQPGRGTKLTPGFFPKKRKRNQIIYFEYNSASERI